MQRNALLLFGLVLLLGDFTFAQLQGKVTDGETGEPLVGATVALQGTDFYGITDFEGNYEIPNAPEGTFTALCSYIGYKNQTQQVEIAMGTTLDFRLEVDLLQMDEVVVTGLGSKNSKARAAVAVQRIDAADLTEKASFNSVQELLAGKVAGVSIQRTGGGFGAATRFVVRSGGGINGNGQPLIFIDGVKQNNTTLGSSNAGEGGGISSLAGLNPEDIANIEVIKGPAGSATYGTGAANGVVLITTKRGASGKDWEVNYRGTIGFNDMRPIKELEFRNFEYFNNNYFQTGPITKHSFNVSGGNEKFRAYFAVDKNNEEGATPDNQLDQLSARFNMDFSPGDKLSLQSSLQFSNTEVLFPQRGRGDGEFGYLTFIPLPYDTRFDPTLPANFAPGKTTDVTSLNTLNASLTGNYRPFADHDGALNGLSAGFTLGINSLDNQNEFLSKNRVEEVDGFDAIGTRGLFNSRSTDLTFTSNVSFAYQTGKFSGTSSVGLQMFDEKSNGGFVSRDNFLLDLPTINATSQTTVQPTEFNVHSRSAGIFTSHNILYDEGKFGATFAIRRDYSSVIDLDENSILYPSANFVLRWDKFDWMPKVFTLLKSRFAYGETGTLPGRTDGIPTLFGPAQSVYGTGLIPTSLGNSALVPERVKEIEIGLDGVIGNFGFEFTYYKNKATNSLVPRPYVPSSGLIFSSPNFNLGSVEGSGFEAQVNASFAGKALGGWRVNVGVTAAYQENTVTSLGGSSGIFDGAGGGRQAYIEGFPKGAYINNASLGGVFSDGTQTYADAPEGTVPLFDFAPVDPDQTVPAGGLLAVRQSDGPIFLGTNTPDWIGGLTLNVDVGDFSLYTLAEWKTGFYVYNEQVIDQYFFGLDVGFFDGFGTNSLAYDRNLEELGLATGFNTGATVLTPGTQAYTDAANLFASTAPVSDANVIQPGDFIKVREISLSYNFRKFIANSKFIKGLRMGVSGTNLFNWFKRKPSIQPYITLDGERGERWMAGYSGLDSENTAFGANGGPATGTQSGTLPRGRTFTSFIALKF